MRSKHELRIVAEPPAQIGAPEATSPMIPVIQPVRTLKILGIEACEVRCDECPNVIDYSKMPAPPEEDVTCAYYSLDERANPYCTKSDYACSN